MLWAKGMSDEGTSGDLVNESRLSEEEKERVEEIRERQSERATASGSDLAETDFLLTVIHKLGVRAVIAQP